MMNLTLKRLLIVCALIVLSVVSVAAFSQDASDYSEAQMVLFANQHLSNINSRAMLHYDFRQSGTDTDEIDDRVTLEITGITERGGKDVEAVFLSGDNNRPYAGIKNFRSNPLIMLFLQWDAEKMSDVSNTSHHFFRHKMRNAFIDKAQSASVTVSYGGNRVAGTRVILKPFPEGEDADIYQNFVNKQYEFIIADTVPGGIYSITTTLPGNATEGKPREHTEMVFNRINPGTAVSE